MSEKRIFPRFSCQMKVRFHFHEGDPDTVDPETSPSKKGKGIVLDISRGGIFIATDTHVSINIPIIIDFRTKREAFTIGGTIVRTGRMKDNPSEVAMKYNHLRIRRNMYVAVQFKQPIENFNENEILKP
jgi:hypothetical protein